MKAAIIAAGQFPRTEYPRYLLDSAQLKICCDSALTTLEKHGIVPDVVIGDMDSVCSRALARFKGRKIQIEEQESNDLTKAFHFVLEEYPETDTIYIIGATGRSEAHTLGNISLLMQYEKDFALCSKGISVEMVSDFSTIFAIGGSCELHLGKGRRVSLFTCDQSLKVHSEGLQWPLDSVVFDCWWKGSLNVASDDIVKLELSHPAPLLLVLD